MIAIDGFEFKVIVVFLLNSSLQVNSCNRVQVFEFSQKLKDALVANLSDGHLYASEVQNHLAEESFFDDDHYFWLGRGVYDHFFKEGEGIKTDILLRWRKGYLLYEKCQLETLRDSAFIEVDPRTGIFI